MITYVPVDVGCAPLTSDCVPFQIVASLPSDEIVLPALDLQALEDRVLYSVGPIPGDSAAVNESLVMACCDFDGLDMQIDLVAEAIDLIALNETETHTTGVVRRAHGPAVADHVVSCFRHRGI